DAGLGGSSSNPSTPLETRAACADTPGSGLLAGTSTRSGRGRMRQFSGGGIAHTSPSIDTSRRLRPDSIRTSGNAIVAKFNAAPLVRRESNALKPCDGEACDTYTFRSPGSGGGAGVSPKDFSGYGLLQTITVVAAVAKVCPRERTRT